MVNVSTVVKKSDRRRRPVVNLAPCSCAAAVMYRSTFPCCAHCKTRHCLTDASTDANKRFAYVAKPYPMNRFRNVFTKIGKMSQNIIKSSPLFLKGREGRGERGKTSFLVKRSFHAFPASPTLIGNSAKFLWFLRPQGFEQGVGYSQSAFACSDFDFGSVGSVPVAAA